MKKTKYSICPRHRRGDSKTPLALLRINIFWNKLWKYFPQCITDNEEKIVDVCQTTESNISDEPSIFLGLNFDADSADDQNQPDQQPKKVQKIQDDFSFQNSASKMNSSSTAVQDNASKTNNPSTATATPKVLDSNKKSSKSASSLSSLVCYASSEDDEN